jgi:glycosyltransferase involved in cell wall biosynthesis
LWAPAELRDGQNLVLVPPSDPRELAHSVRLLLDDQPRANAIGMSARESVLAGATIERYAERLLEVCRLALASR